MRILRVALLVGALLVPALAAVPVAAADDPVHLCHPAASMGDGCGADAGDCILWVSLGHPSFLCLTAPPY